MELEDFKRFVYVKYKAIWLRIYVMCFENVGQLVLQTYLALASGAEMDFIELSSIGITMIVIVLEVIISEHFNEFVVKFVMLLGVCITEIVMLYNLMELTDKRSDYLKELFPTIKWDRT